MEIHVHFKGGKVDVYHITGIPNARSLSRTLMGNPQVVKVNLLYTGERGATR
ncbi:hypothetical protein CJ97_gp06 [Ralstonia phage RSB2]|uniref:Uncharacterized protein ORF6 n=1 Tax=Ralstonia phage RSB2 TaxID=913183 RepID=E5RUY6_9CAUD|nr:hypothetical protein CJ97_gp06 [Ralstonia phage RSB2]BAJ51794.1 hypothetical protein [Ralstonia phage RSB2]